MEIIIKRDVLVKAVNDVLKAISSSVNVPILTGIKIVANADGVFLSGSDTNISIQRVIPLKEKEQEIVTIKKEGSVVLNAKFFSELIKKLQNEIHIITDNKNVTKVKSGNSVFSLNGMPADEYPKLPTIEGDSDFVLTGADIQLLVKQTVFAAATSETRPLLTGVNITLKDGLKAVTTDSHRLCLKKMKVAGSEEKQVTIPGKALTELSKIVEDPEEKIDVVLTDNQVLFKAHNLSFLTRLLDGNYPDISRLIPTEFKTALKGQLKDLKAALERCSLIQGKNEVVRLEAKGNEITLTRKSPEFGDLIETLVGFEKDGEDLSISFSYRYVLQSLGAVSSADKIRMDFTGAMRPFLIHADGDESLTQLILPVRTE